MKRYRIGKTLEIRWPILTNKEPLPLEGRDLKLVVKLGHLYQKELSFASDGNVVIFLFQGRDQSFLGVYQLTLWENLGKGRQTVVDCCDAFELVATTNDEGIEIDDNLEINVLELGSGNLETGLPGPAGPGVPSGGQPGQVLTKATDEDYATEWGPGVDSLNDAINTLAHSECTLDERVQSLEQVFLALISGKMLVPKLQVRSLGVWGDNNLIGIGNGVPTKAPDKAGQFYVDMAARVLYYSTGNAAVADWKIA